MLLGEHIHHGLRVTYDNIEKKHERAKQKGSPIYPEAELYGAMYKEFKAHQMLYQEKDAAKRARIVSEDDRRP